MLANCWSCWTLIKTLFTVDITTEAAPNQSQISNQTHQMQTSQFFFFMEREGLESPYRNLLEKNQSLTTSESFPFVVHRFSTNSTRVL